MLACAEAITPGLVTFYLQREREQGITIRGTFCGVLTVMCKDSIFSVAKKVTFGTNGT